MLFKNHHNPVYQKFQRELDQHRMTKETEQPVECENELTNAQFQQFLFQNYMRILKKSDVMTVMCKFCLNLSALTDIGTFIDHVKVWIWKKKIEFYF